MIKKIMMFLFLITSIIGADDFVESVSTEITPELIKSAFENLLKQKEDLKKTFQKLPKAVANQLKQAMQEENEDSFEHYFIVWLEKNGLSFFSEQELILYKRVWMVADLKGMQDGEKPFAFAKFEGQLYFISSNSQFASELMQNIGKWISELTKDQENAELNEEVWYSVFNKAVEFYGKDFFEDMLFLRLFKKTVQSWQKEIFG